MIGLRTLSSILSSRAFFSRAMGGSFGGDRDLYEALGYKRNLTSADYWGRYKRNSIAARIIETYPKATWRGTGGELIEDDDPTSLTPFEEAWFDLQDRLKIWTVFKAADILSGLDTYSVVLMGFPGNTEFPLPERVDPEDLVYMKPYSASDAKIVEWDADARSPRFGLPKIYQITKTGPSQGLGTGSGKDQLKVNLRVHYSRIIHVAEGALDDQTMASPRLERVWNLLDDLDKVTGGGAEAFWHQAHKGYQFDLDADAKLEPDEEEKMSEEIDQYMHSLRRFVRTRKIKMNSFGSEVATFDRNVASIVGQISSGTEIPQRILLGSERGQLASEQDRLAWAERVQDRRSEFAAPLVIRPFADQLIALGVLPPLQGKTYEVRWPNLHDLSDDERASIAVKWASLNARQLVVMPNEIRDRILGLEPLENVASPEEIQKIQDELHQTSDPNQSTDTKDKATEDLNLVARGRPSKRLVWMAKRNPKRLEALQRKLTELKIVARKSA